MRMPRGVCCPQLFRACGTGAKGGGKYGFALHDAQRRNDAADDASFAFALILNIIKPKISGTIGGRAYDTLGLLAMLSAIADFSEKISNTRISEIKKVIKVAKRIKSEFANLTGMKENRFCGIYPSDNNT